MRATTFKMATRARAAISLTCILLSLCACNKHEDEYHSIYQVGYSTHFDAIIPYDTVGLSGIFVLQRIYPPVGEVKQYDLAAVRLYDTISGLKNVFANILQLSKREYGWYTAEVGYTDSVVTWSVNTNTGNWFTTADSQCVPRLNSVINRDTIRKPVSVKLIDWQNVDTIVAYTAVTNELISAPFGIIRDTMSQQMDSVILHIHPKQFVFLVAYTHKYVTYNGHKFLLIKSANYQSL